MDKLQNAKTLFFAEAEGNINNDTVAQKLQKLKKYCTQLKISGGRI